MNSKKCKNLCHGFEKSFGGTHYSWIGICLNLNVAQNKTNKDLPSFTGPGPDARPKFGLLQGQC